MTGPGLSLVNGTLTPTPAPNGFVTSDRTAQALAPGAPNYRVVQHGSPDEPGSFSMLAVNGDDADFYLCMAEGGQVDVAWKGGPDNGTEDGYDGSYAVRLQVEYHQ
ncbi:hypothetical protein AcV5_001736 [Taiwanofungus camphoratus]|nr:hypothetical protein AcV5_001736 [Antrodia cinnamomea]